MACKYKHIFIDRKLTELCNFKKLYLFDIQLEEIIYSNPPESQSKLRKSLFIETFGVSCFYGETTRGNFSIDLPKFWLTGKDDL